jgi:hypothetical protein
MLMRNTTGETPANSRPGTPATSVVSTSSPNFRVMNMSPSVSHQGTSETTASTTTTAVTFHPPASEPNVPQSSSSSQIGAPFLHPPPPAPTTYKLPPDEDIQYPGIEHTSMNALSAMQTTLPPKASMLGRGTPKSAKETLFRTNGVTSLSHQS